MESSLSRIEVTLLGPGADRVQVVCNGRPVPMQHGNSGGRRFGAVRFRAWQPNEGFHPTIAPHVPLTFHIVPRDGTKALAGCRYHAWAPPGVTYTELPADAEAAAARRAALFELLPADSLGPIEVADASVAPEAPMTLDLRRLPPGDRRG